jgi:hypothetical protein
VHCLSVISTLPPQFRSCHHLSSFLARQFIERSIGLDRSPPTRANVNSTLIGRSTQHSYGLCGDLDVEKREKSSGALREREALRNLWHLPCPAARVAANEANFTWHRDVISFTGLDPYSTPVDGADKLQRSRMHMPLNQPQHSTLTRMVALLGNVACNAGTLGSQADSFARLHSQ